MFVLLTSFIIRSYLPFLLLFIGGSILTVGDIVMKKWVTNNQNSLFALGMGIYLIGLYFLAQSFKYKNIAIASIIFVVFNSTTLLSVSWLYFKKTLSPLQIVGIGLGICSVICLKVA